MLQKVKVLVAQSCLTLYSPMDYSPPGSSVHEILQARIQEWIDVPFSRESSQLKDWTWVFWWQADSLPSEPGGKKPILTPCWKLFIGLLFSAFVITVIHNSLPQKHCPMPDCKPKEALFSSWRNYLTLPTCEYLKQKEEIRYKGVL